jgi:hypothetical protein
MEDGFHRPDEIVSVRRITDNMDCVDWNIISFLEIRK